ncbi:MAG: TadE/TadG family type IV pilus assembly protein [Planctomycetaceae bacterium]
MIVRTFRTSRCTRNPARRAATTVEMAIVLPVLFVIVFGAIEFSRLNMLKHLANVAAYEGARHGIVIGASAADVETKAGAILNAGQVVNATITTTPATITEETTAVQVHVSVPVTGNFWVLPAFVSGSITGECELSTERQSG